MSDPSVTQDRLYRALRLGRPLPRVAIEVGPSVRGWVLRLGLLALAFVGGLLVLSGSFQWAAAGVAFLFLAVRPTPVLSIVYASLLGLALLLQPFDPTSVRPYVMLFLIHLIVVLGTAIGRLGLSARYEWRALWSRGSTFLVVQLVSQVTALAVAGIGAGRPALAWLAVGAAVALAVLVWVMVVVANAAAIRAQRGRV